MTFSGDPYRILGLAPGAQLDDVKRAYRRLAKRYHPDAAGPEAVVRFLAIQRAYEAIAGPTARNGRGPASRRASAADPDRARATRDAYGRRTAGWAGWSRPSDGGSGGRPSEAGPSRGPEARGPDASGGESAAPGRRAGPSSSRPDGRRRATGPTGPSRAEDTGTRRNERPRRDEKRRDGSPRAEDEPRRRPIRRKATLSSTTYDDAAHEPRHPEWQGSSWYGTSSGTYWTINPREYADPRKHGPEYQARARRGAGPPEAGIDAGDPVGAGSHPTTSEARGGWGEREPNAAPRPRSTSGGRSAGNETTSGEPTRPSGIPTAGSIGLASGVVAAIPAAVVVLGSTMSGDLALAAVALAVPGVVAVAVGLGVGLLRRGSH